MIGRDRIRAIFEGRPADRVGYWSGSPHPDAAKEYRKALAVRDEIDLAVALGDDAVWMPAEWDCWYHPDGLPIWPAPKSDDWIAFESRVFADTEDPADIESYPWPEVRHFDFRGIAERMRRAHRKGLAVLGGPWCSLSTTLMGLFGVEDFLIKMHTNPQIVESVTEHVTDFYVAAVHRFFREVDEYPEVFFFASDLGSQEDLLMSPEMCRRFVLPGLSRIVETAAEYEVPILLHSCGSVARIIPDLIDMGIDGLHPLQAKARGMSAAELACYKDEIVFVGAVDSQELLPAATPEEVEAEVERLKAHLGERFVVSPSHEALLTNVPLENVMAMRRAAVANPHWRVIQDTQPVRDAVGA